MLDLFQVCYHCLSADNWQALDLSLACVSWIQIDSSRRWCSRQSQAAQIRLKKEEKTTSLMSLLELWGFLPLGFAVFFGDFSSYSQPSSAHLALWQLSAPGYYYLIKPGNFSHFGRFFWKQSFILSCLLECVGVKGGESGCKCKVQEAL